MHVLSTAHNKALMAVLTGATAQLVGKLIIYMVSQVLEVLVNCTVEHGSMGS